MLLEFKVKNFRSFKDEVVFSLVAEAYKSKDFNFFVQDITGDDPVRLLKAAAIWGPNASGKTNLLKAMTHLIQFLRTPPDVEEEIRYYAPFFFAKETEDQPVVFDVSFIGPDKIRFEYHVAFDKTAVLEESLVYYPKGSERLCFERKSGSGIIDFGMMGPDWKKKKYDVYKNQLFLSQFGKTIPDEVLGIVYSQLVNIRVVNANDAITVKLMHKNMIKKLLDNPNIQTRLAQLISKTDKLVDELEIRQVDKDSFKFPKELPAKLIDQILEENKYEIYGRHKYFENDDLQGYRTLPFREESQGTQNLFALGGYLFEALEEGNVVFVDELDTSLHSSMAKLICELFQSEITNPKHAQLIFTTHDTSLLDESMLRRDQIWFTEKDEYGVSDLYSLQDIDGVREDSVLKNRIEQVNIAPCPESPPLITYLAMTKSRKAVYTILIICEGENTEPSYFHGIRDLVDQDDIWIDPVSITIRPEPKHDDEDAGLPRSKYKTPRRRRQLAGEGTEIDSGQPPYQLIVKGRNELEAEVYDEVWAVFDHDNHPKRKEAFELAAQPVNGKVVNIAFSSICFETWILLHFEKCLNAFDKSECRQGRDILECNSGKHPDDCNGSKCLGGYLRQKNYLPFSTKSRQSLFPVLRNNLDQAFINAAWLRYKVNGLKNPIYDINPYTDVDRLVSHLLQRKEDIHWADLSSGISHNGYQVSFSDSGNQVTITFQNNSDRTWIINPTDLRMIDAMTNEETEIMEKKVLLPNNSYAIETTRPATIFYVRLAVDNTVFFLE